MVTKEYAAEHPEEYMGKDIALGDDGDITFGSRNDFAFAEYYDNLKQAIIDRLRTQLGEDELHPNYGSRLYRLIGTKPDDLSLPTAKMHTKEALLQEPRIEEIKEIKATWADNTKRTIELEITVKPVKNLPDLNLVYELFI